MITVKKYFKLGKAIANYEGNEIETEKPAPPIKGQTINEIQVGDYRAWVGLPRKIRPNWEGSKFKNKEDEKVEEDFEDEVMRVTGTLWDRLGKEVKYVVIEKSKQIFVPAGKKKAYYRFDPRGEPYVAEPPGGFEHPDPKYLSVLRKLSGEEKIEEEEPAKREFRGRTGEGRRHYRSARGHSTIRRIGG